MDLSTAAATQQQAAEPAAASAPVNSGDASGENLSRALADFKKNVNDKSDSEELVVDEELNGIGRKCSTMENGITKCVDPPGQDQELINEDSAAPLSENQEQDNALNLINRPQSDNSSKSDEKPNDNENQDQDIDVVSSDIDVEETEDAHTASIGNGNMSEICDNDKVETDIVERTDSAVALKETDKTKDEIDPEYKAYAASEEFSELEKQYGEESEEMEAETEDEEDKTFGEKQKLNDEAELDGQTNSDVEEANDKTVEDKSNEMSNVAAALEMAEAIETNNMDFVEGEPNSMTESEREPSLISNVAVLAELAHAMEENRILLQEGAKTKTWTNSSNEKDLTFNVAALAELAEAAVEKNGGVYEEKKDELPVDHGQNINGDSTQYHEDNKMDDSIQDSSDQTVDKELTDLKDIRDQILKDFDIDDDDNIQESASSEKEILQNSSGNEVTGGEESVDKGAIECPDQVEEKDLESYSPSKEEKDLTEEILVDDEDMVVTQITSIVEDFKGEIETSNNGNSIQTLHNVTKLPQQSGASRIVQKPVVKEDSDICQARLEQFTEDEDLIIHALDTICPFDAKFISDHMLNRDEHQVERRLSDHSFRKLSFTFQKLPSLIFELLFVNGSERSSSLMLLTEKQLISLKSKKGLCQYGSGIETVQLDYKQRSKFGVDTSKLCEFIVTNIPSKHMPFLKRNVHQLEAFMEASKINYHKSGPGSAAFSKKDQKKNNGKDKKSMTLDSLRKQDAVPIRIGEGGQLHMNNEHKDTLRRIVKTVGRNHWEEAGQLMLAVFDHEGDTYVFDDEVYDKIAHYYQNKMDPDLAIGVFTEQEDKCIIFMNKYWSKVMEEELVWKLIARHLVGRTPIQVKNRFLRVSQSDTDLCKSNIECYSADPTKASTLATFLHDSSYMFGLTVTQKGLPRDMDITTKLQHEVRFLVMGTKEEVFVLPVEDSAIRVTQPGVVQNTFTFDPDRPPEQFITFLKLTFTNGLKKVGLIPDPDSFNFPDLAYNGETIHAMMSRAETDRFIIPRDLFMKLNRKIDGDQTTEFVLPVKRKYTKRIDRLDLHQRDDVQREKLKVKIMPPSAKKAKYKNERE